MNANLLNTADETAAAEEQPGPASVDASETQSMRPDGVPEKFWDQENGQVRVEAMAKSYQELEHKLGSPEESQIPESADAYEVTIDGTSIKTDVDINERLHAAGMSQDQVQTVYELANEKLMPALSDMASQLEANAQTERLKEHFGGDKKWHGARSQLAAWGRQNFSDDVFAALSTTYEGVLTMQSMMSSREPGLGRTNSIGSGPNEAGLKKMMGDPRYWREQDPAYIERVRQGFRSLYPDN